MAATCKYCGVTWNGYRMEHCVAIDRQTGDRCCQTFTGRTLADEHRVGEHHATRGPERRRCLSPDEMRDAGMVLDSRGLWASEEWTGKVDMAYVRGFRAWEE